MFINKTGSTIGTTLIVKEAVLFSNYIETEKNFYKIYVFKFQFTLIFNCLFF